MKKSRIVNIIKEEISSVLSEQQSDVDKVASQIKQRAMAVFKDLAAAGVPKDKAKEAALAAQRAAFEAEDTSKIPGIMAKIQSDAHLAHIGVNNKMPGDQEDQPSPDTQSPSAPIKRVTIPGDFAALQKIYYKIRNRANKGNAADLTRRRVAQHVAKARKMKNGYAALIAHIKKKYPNDPEAQAL